MLQVSSNVKYKEKVQLCILTYRKLHIIFSTLNKHSKLDGKFQGNSYADNVMLI